MLDTTSLLPKNYAKTIDENEGIAVERRDTSETSPSLVQSDLPLNEQGEVIMPTKKRKRPNINYSDVDNPPLHADPAWIYSTTRSTPDGRPPAKKPKRGSKDTRGVILGVWRDSNQPNDNDKHVIYGFIDIHDRLRTRIYAQDRRGKDLQANMPTGAGGCWVTYERIIFDKHLKGLNTAQLKEYVKLRVNTPDDRTPEEHNATNARLAVQGKEIAATQEANGTGSTPRTKTPKSAHSVQPASNKQSRSSTSHTPSFKAVNATNAPTLGASPVVEKPNGIVIGYWAESDSPREADKHAVIGLISDAANNFRVKVQNVTRDGRQVDGNFPMGLGAQWLHYEKVVLDPHLASLSRMEVKEYVRVRTRQIMAGEAAKERKSNEAKAVRETKSTIAAQSTATINGSKFSPERHSSRVEQRKQAEAEAAARAENYEEEVRQKPQAKSKRSAPVVEAAVNPAAQAELDHDMKRLNKVWAAKHTPPAMHMTPMHPTTSMPSPHVDETKYHHGIKYERKKTGPFEGKLCSAPQILNIDGEDYIEYRVLTKPSFF